MADHRTDVLPVLLEIWQDALGCPVEPDNDFFELGGDSIQATLIVARLRRRLGVTLTLMKFLTEVTTPARLAEFISTSTRAST